MINENLIKELLGEEILSVKEIREKDLEAFTNISPLKLANYLKQKDYIKVIEIKNKPNKYKIASIMKLTGVVEKNKNILKIQTENNDYIEYDFNSKDFTKNKDIVLNCIIEYQYNDIVAKIFFDDHYKKYREIEWLYNYLDLITEDTFPYYNDNTDLFKKCPSGYINWLREKGYYICRDSLTSYLFNIQYPNIPQQVREGDFSYYFYHQWNEKQLRVIDDLFAKCNIKKIIKNSIENFELNIKNDFLTFLQKCLCFENAIDYIDNNRDLQYNITTLENLYNKEKNILLANKLQKLNFLNNTIIDDYIIIIPQSIEDLQNEGKQQHNCVGHYYNDSIIRGENLIYFLRDKNKPKKSMVTCRYNLMKRNTQEHRIINNMSTTLKQEDIIKEIDKIINSNLK